MIRQTAYAVARRRVAALVPVRTMAEQCRSDLPFRAAQGKTIGVGDRVPSTTLYEFVGDGPKPVKSDDFFKGRKVVVFGLPGAFTPTCSGVHLPGYVAKIGDFAAKKATVACLSVNDAFVMKAWGDAHSATGKVHMLADGSADFVTQAGLTLDLTAKGLGVRSNRFAFVANDGVIEWLAIEAPGKMDVSSAENVLKRL